MIVYKTIMSENEKWKLSANFDEIENKWYGVTLKVPKKACEAGETNFWDNEKYLFGDFFNLVEKMVNKQSAVPVTELNMHPYFYLTNNKKQLKQVYEILVYGKSLGWDKV